MFLRKILRRAAKMCSPARLVQKSSMAIACLQLGAALCLLCAAGAFSVDTYRSFRMVDALLDSSSAVLLIGVIGAVCIEDRMQ